ncbi:MAG: hypothetical protein J0I21_04420, partial [Alphaproteobacteria bacterium]|nr:hypothetical protein [Alphaproteobacteria bacterium]
MPAPAERGRGAASARWADLRLRAASAVVLAALALGGWWLGGWAWRGTPASRPCGAPSSRR